MTKEMDRMRETIAKLLVVQDWGSGLIDERDWEKLMQEDKVLYMNDVTQILSLETDTCRIAVVRKEAELPENPYDKLYHSPQEKVHWVVHNKGQLDMLQAGFVQEGE